MNEVPTKEELEEYMRNTINEETALSVFEDDVRLYFVSYDGRKPCKTKRMEWFPSSESSLKTYQTYELLEKMGLVEMVKTPDGMDSWYLTDKGVDYATFVLL
jgi:hypothetical protein